MMKSYRSETEWEREVLKRLLDQPFPGRDQLNVQLKDILVCLIDENGGLRIQVKSGPMAEVSSRVPTEAECLDKDGTKIHILLHVIGGFANELEIYKEDGSRIIEMPSANNLQLI